jgi:hypothetical protein
MEGNFLSRYNNKLSEWSKLIDDDPSNKGKYQDEMSIYDKMYAIFNSIYGK